MADNSDYSKSRLNILKFLEGTTFDTPVNRSLVENTYNRFLTKDETVESIGTVGIPDTTAAIDRQLKEDTVHRQTYQLQPLLHKKIATVDYTSSFKDILAELQRLGVDISRMDQWADTEQFNFAPPVELDKLVNYRDYYWYDPDDTGTAPQYIVIKNPCTVQTNRLLQRQKDITGVGSLALSGINLATNEFIVPNNVQVLFPDSTVFDVDGSDSLRGVYNVLSTRVDNGVTYIKPTQTIASNLYNGAALTFDSQIANLTAQKNQICDASAGWDVGLWDDALPLVEGAISASDPVLLQYLKENDIDTYTLIVKNHPEYVNSSGAIVASDARALWQWLDTDQPQFDITWDGQGTPSERNAWQVDNKWVHKLDMQPGAISKSIRAETPIIEYLPNLQLNQWSQVIHQWMYRADPVRGVFAIVDNQPTMADYAASNFKDKWAYVGVIGTVPTSTQALNTTAVLMSTDAMATSILIPKRSFTVTAVNASTHRISFVGSPTLLSGSKVTIVNNVTLASVTTTSAASISAGTTSVTLTDVTGIAVGSTILIDSSSVYDVVLFPDTMTSAALSGTNATRIYVDQVQVQGTFDELTIRKSGQYYVAGIKLQDMVSVDQRVEAYANPAAASDIGKNQWSVRSFTQMDDKQYAEDGKPTKIVNVTEFFQMKQSKSIGEQKVPLFDLFNPDGSTANKTNQIFFYQLDQSSPVNKYTNYRMKTTTATGVVFYFEQMLVDYDNGPMLCYKDLDSITTSNPTGLQTIWRTDLTNRYVPKLVNIDRQANGDLYYDADGVEQAAIVDETNGDWEILSQHNFNASHENKKFISSTDLTEHIKTIIANQVTLDGFLPSRYGFRLLEKINYGVGGTIKEHNGSYDTLASTLFVSGSTPPAVISYAETAYETALSGMRDYVTANAVEFLTNKGYGYIADLANTVTAAAIAQHEDNDNNNVVFGDSNTYIDGLGIKNWPATIPFLGLGELYRPDALVDANLAINEIRHHDGHYDTYTVSQADQIGIARRIVRTRYSLSNGVSRFYGWTATQSADSGPVISSFLSIPMNRLQPGDVWVDGQVFKRFQVIQISNSAPSFEAADGALWLREADEQLMVKQTVAGASKWVVLSGSPAGNISAAWKDVNLSQVLNVIVLEVENRLFAAAQKTNAPKVLAKSLYVRTTADQALYSRLHEANFDQFARERQINTPYASVYKSADPFSWNYGGVNANLVQANTYVNVWNPSPENAEIKWAGYWAGIYQNIFGTAYPHREPWVLQGFVMEPEWWSDWYADTTKTRVWNAAMWSNILANRIPAQFDAPSEVLYTGVDPSTGIDYKVMTKKFNYIPVNVTRVIKNTLGDILYNLDDLFPPYDSRLFDIINSDVISGSSLGKPMIRRPDALLGVNLKAAYKFGDGSPIEWEWAKASDSRYGELETAFLMQPIRFIDSTWGTKFATVGGLKINTETHKVFSHKDTIFHGDIVDSKIYESVGLNQWYVNYNRSSGLDFKVSNFRDMWTNWDMSLAYQFGCYLNTRSLDVSSSSYDMIRDDFTIISKKSPGYDSQRVDSLQVTVANYGSYRSMGSLKVPTGDGYSWSFMIDVPSSETQLSFYGVAKYEYNVVDLETGLLEIAEGTLPWKDGDQVQLYTTQYAPYPLDPSWSYYVSTVEGSTKQFRISRSKVDAMNKNGTFLRTPGTGVQYISQIHSTFNAQGGQATPNAWNHVTVDKNKLNTINLPYTVQGVQGLIDFVDGYAAYLSDQGIRANDSSAREIDSSTGRLVSWQTELERAITKIYTGLGKSNTSIKQYGNTYKYSVRDATEDVDVFVLSDVTVLPFQLAQEVYLFTEGTTPPGTTLNKPYYIIPVNATSFQLASTPENAYDNIGLNVTGEGLGQQYVGVFPSTFVSGDDYAEINPFRNNVWIETDVGLVADVFTGGSQDAATEVTIYDQYGRPLPKGSLTVLREDKLTRVTVRPNMQNDVLVTSASDPYNYIHIGGVNFYIDGYEHVVLFNNYTTDGYLIYDPYIGMDVSRLSVSFSRSTKKTLRPSVGGYYFSNGEMIRNLEASVTDMRSYYDTYGGSSASDYMDYSRALLGYDDPTYLDQLNTPERSKFLFWKGMIQRKGSKNTINAFINSKHFVDAHIDEFWAYKVAEFGDARQKYKPEINIRVADSYTSDFRYEFAAPGDIVSSRFVGVTYDDETRFVNPMEVKAEMGNRPLYFDAEVAVGYSGAYTAHATGNYITLSQRLDQVWVEYDVAGIRTAVSTQAGLKTDSGLTTQVGLAKINDRVYKLAASVPNTALTAYGYVPAAAKLDPILTLDKSSNVTVASSKVWDPINGYHYYAALKDVTYWLDTDPADYANVSWTSEQVGKKWVDSSTIGYVPYDDTTVFPEFNDRMARWGRLAGWAAPAVYEWVRTTKTPEEFAAAAAAEEGDVSITIADRASGTPYTIIRRDSDNAEITLTPVSAVFDVDVRLAEMKANPLYAGLDIHVYVNGVFTVQRVLADVTAADFNYTLGDYVVLNPAMPVGQVGFTTDYRYTTVTEADSQGNDTSVYYFWAQARNVAPADHLTAAVIASQLAYPDAPYHLYKKFQALSGNLPNRYTQVILRNIAQLVNDDNRYVAQFTRDFTLRDKLSSGKTALDLKNKHTEWVLFREKQPYKLSQDLWNTMAEALIGYKTDGFDAGIRTPVPTMTYTLYDQKNNTNTRFGMGEGQTFVDRAQGLATIQAILQDPTFDTAPIDKYVFLETYTFDTPVNIKRSLEYIFSNFSDKSVNHVFFEVMRDALSNKTDFSGLFMTSVIALHGIKILETSGSVVK